MTCSLCGGDVNAMEMDNVSPICEACIEDFNSEKNYLIKFESRKLTKR